MTFNRKLLNLFLFIGYLSTAFWGLIQGISLFQKTGMFYLPELYYAAVFVMGIISLFFVLHRGEPGKKFIRVWNWFFLISTLLMLWLGVPEIRNDALCFLGFAVFAVLAA